MRGAWLGKVFNRGTLVLLLLILLSLLIWFVGPLLAVSVADAQWRPLGSTEARWLVLAVLWLLWILKLVIVWWRRRNVNQALMNQLLKLQTPTSPSAQAAGTEEVAALSQRFADAAAVLRRTRFGSQAQTGWRARFSGQYLYQLPWYAFIGAPGSGKTTALVNAGLTFPLAQQLGKNAIQGLGGTRNCDWWFTNEAVLIDTAGRYTTQESNEAVDKAEWQGFMNLLKRFRPRQPLNGVLLTLSVSDLLQMSEVERQAHVATLRQRLAELREGLGLQFPVYVLVTKVDLLSGFTEYFLSLSREERAQVWGFTLPYEPNAAAAPAALREVFLKEFDLLLKRLNDGMQERLLAEPDLSRRALSYALPQQFSGLRELLAGVLESLFSDSRFQQQPLLRGVYFTSGTQEGTPFDRVLGAMRRGFKLNVRLGTEAAMPGTGKSFFLQDLLQKVIFPEYFIAGRRLATERRLRWLAWATMAGCALLFVGLNLAWSPWVSYGHNLRYVGEVDAKAQALAEQVAALPPDSGQGDLMPLLPLLNQAHALASSPDFEGLHAPLTYSFGLFQGPKLDAAARQTYQRLLDEGLLPRVAQRLQLLLRQAPAGRADYLYQALKAYLMLGDEGRFDAEWLKLWIRADWDHGLAPQGTAERSQLDAHLDALMQDRALRSPFALDKALVQQARDQLNQQTPSQRSYNRLKSRLMGPQLPDFSLVAASGPEAPNVFQRASGQPLSAGLPGLFTRKGYAAFRKELGGSMMALDDEDAWVLGRASVAPNPADRLQQSQQLMRLYMNDYARQWQDFLGDVRLIPRTSLADTLAATRILAAADSPLLQLTRAAAAETRLGAPESGGSGRVDQAVGQLDRLRQEVSSVAGLVQGSSDRPEQRPELIVDGLFAPLQALTQGTTGATQLDQVRKSLEDYLASLVAADSALRGGNIPRTQEADDRLRGQAQSMPPPVKAVLEALVSQAGQQIAGGTRSSASASVKGGVGQTCNALIRGRYPFTPQSHQDVLANDFAQLFAPGGLIDDTFQKNLAPYVDTARPTWAPKPGPEGAAAGSAADLAQFQRAAIIRDAFFAPGSRSMKFDLIVRITQLGGLEKVDLDIDGQTLSASAGVDGARRVSWPGPAGTLQVRLRGAKGVALSADGPWALNRLIDQGQVQSSASPERLQVQFSVEGKTVAVEFAAQSLRNPLRLPQLQAFACPGRG